MEAYVARRRKKNGKNKILVAFVFLLIIASGIILYKFYEKIEVEELDKGSETVRTLRTLDEEKEEQKEVVDVIAQATSSVVGISKVKNIGSTIFLKDGSSKLGLGTGLIVTDNGYILTNAHVSGEKYSTCYVTLEDGTGIVHNAPGFGEDDYNVGVKYKLVDPDSPLCPMDEDGCFTDEFPMLKGTYFKSADPIVIEHLKKEKRLLLTYLLII